MPAGLSGPIKLSAAQRKTILSVALLILLAVALLLVVRSPLPARIAGLIEAISVSNTGGQALQEAGPTEVLAVHGQSKPTPTLQALVATATQVATPSRTLPTAAAVANQTENESYGEHGSYIIHKVAKEETLDSIAGSFQSSPEAIAAVNQFLPDPLWEGWLMVIPSGITDPTGQPSFEVYLVATESNITDLSQKLEVDPQALTEYNTLDSSGEIPAGTWLLVRKSLPE